MKILLELRSFLINPRFLTAQRFGWRALIYVVLLQLILSILIVNISDLFIGESDSLPLNARFDPMQFNIGFYVLGAVLAPLKEELKYRLLLGYFHFDAFVISCSLMVADLLVTLVIFMYSMNRGEAYIPYYYFSIATLSTTFVLALHKVHPAFRTKIQLWFDKNYLILFYGLLTIYGMWHVLFSGQSDKMNVFVLFFLHFVNGFFFAFVRIKYNIVIAILYHFLYNLPYLLVNVILYYMG
jgi:hypothetical protein